MSQFDAFMGNILNKMNKADMQNPRTELDYLTIRDKYIEQTEYHVYPNIQDDIPYHLLRRYNNDVYYSYENTYDKKIELIDLNRDASDITYNRNIYHVNTFKGLYDKIFKNYEFVILDVGNQCDGDDTPIVAEYYPGFFPTYVLYESKLCNKFNYINVPYFNEDCDFLHYAYVYELENNFVIITKLNELYSSRLNSFIAVAGAENCCVLSCRSEYYVKDFGCDVYLLWSKIYDENTTPIKSTWLTVKGTDAERDIGPVIFNPKIFEVKFDESINRYILRVKDSTTSSLSKYTSVLYGLTSARRLCPFYDEDEIKLPASVVDLSEVMYDEINNKWLDGFVVNSNFNGITVKCMNKFNIDNNYIYRNYIKELNSYVAGDTLYERKFVEVGRTSVETCIHYLDITELSAKLNLEKEQLDSILLGYSKYYIQNYGYGSVTIEILYNERVSDTKMVIVFKVHDTGD